MASLVNSATTAVVPVNANQNLSSKVTSATDKTVQTVSAKIPAIKYELLAFKIKNGSMDSTEEIFIPSIKLVYTNTGKAFFADQPRHMGESSETPVELDPAVVEKMRTIAIKAKELLDLKATMDRNVIFNYDPKNILAD